MKIQASNVIRFLIVLLILAGVLIPSRALGLATPLENRLPGRAAAGDGNTEVFLPLIRKPAPGPPPPANTRRVNVPYFPGEIGFSEMAIFWFGRVTPNENYADVRVGYNNTEIYIDLNIIDQFIWYDESPSASNLTAYDAVTLLLDLSGPTSGAPGNTSYRFEAQFRNWEDPASYQAAYRGNTGSWQPASVPFSSESWYRGWGGPNQNSENDGWVMEYRIPFASLGMTGPPPDGSTWGLGVVLHDRDTAGPSGIPNKTWPEGLDRDRPGTWGEFVFGLPRYTPPALLPVGEMLIRDGFNGVTLRDVGVGGYTTCGQGLAFWTEWGNANYGGYQETNVQNQRDIADWPCFSKYLLTIPLDTVPTGKAILSATLTLTQFGSSEPSQAEPSYLQVLTTDEDWDEYTVTWNNAPLAQENFNGTWVNPLAFPGWENVPEYDWDVSLPVYQAYQNASPVRLILYSADYAYHSGRYFLTSETGDWLAEARPSLKVVWAEP